MKRAGDLLLNLDRCGKIGDMGACKMEHGELDKLRGIIVFGANGGGKTTLGRELAHVLGYKHMDIEDYYFEKSEITYAMARSREGCLDLVFADIKKHRDFVVTAVTGDFGGRIMQLYRLAVHFSASLELCMTRIKNVLMSSMGSVCRKAAICMSRSKDFLILRLCAMY